MGMMDKIKKLVTLPPEDEYEDDAYLEEEDNNLFSSKKAQEDSRKYNDGGFFSKPASKTTNLNINNQIQVVLVKPSKFEDAPSIADHLNERKTVVLNLELANREVSRRLIDFLSGTAYAQKGNIKKVAHSTYIITPANDDVLGDLILDDVENAMYLG